jgi:esterase/lipase superfamily enzyme
MSDESKVTSTWHSPRLDRDISVTRWGHVGTPVLIFPTAAGDHEECERFLMIDTLAEFLEAGRIKLYSLDSVAGAAWMKEDNSSVAAARVQNQFDSAIYHEVVPAIRTDCQSEDIEIIATGASIGAFNALAATCRHPDVFSTAICMSGTYDLSKFIEGPITEDYFVSSPLHFLPELAEGDHLEQLRKRFILLTHGSGNYEEPKQSWDVANVLGACGVPNRVDDWGDEYHHDWPTWREMLPKYLDELLDQEAAEPEAAESSTPTPTE